MAKETFCPNCKMAISAEKKSSEFRFDMQQGESESLFIAAVGKSKTFYQNHAFKNQPHCTNESNL